MTSSTRTALLFTLVIPAGVGLGIIFSWMLNRDYAAEARHGADRYCIDLHGAPCQAVSCLGMDCTIRLYKGIEPQRFICDAKGCAAK